MGPILGITLGTAYRDTAVAVKALRNEAIGVGLTLFFGMVTGLIMCLFEDDNWDTSQMSERGALSGLAPGVLIALPCGMALAISVTSADGTVLVGVAIAAALLPPIVNAGLEFTFGLVKEADGHTEKINHLEHSANSFLLFVLNLISIYIGCLLVFAIKKVQRAPKYGGRGRLSRIVSRTKGLRKRGSAAVAAAQASDEGTALLTDITEGGGDGGGGGGSGESNVNIQGDANIF
eukprot:UC1_evm1s807